MEFGIQIKLEEQQILLARHRAITEPLPKDMNPVWSGDRAEVLSLVGVEEAADVGKDPENKDAESQSCASVDSSSIDMFESQSCEKLESSASPEDPSCGSTNPGSIDSSQNLELEFTSHPPKKVSLDIPTDAEGCAENPDAYKLWQPKKMEGEVLETQN